MPEVAEQRVRFPLVRSALWIVLASGVVAGAAMAALTLLDRPEQRPLAGWAVAVTAGFGLLGLAPVWVLDRRMPGGAAYGFMAGILVRLAGCGAAVLVAQAWGAPRAFGYWVAGCYVVLLGVEVALIGRYVRQTLPPLPRPSNGSSDATRHASNNVESDG